MAQITLNSSGVASNGALVLQSNGTTTAVTISTGQVATFANDAVVNGLTVGRGAGAVATNTAVGASALAGTNTGTLNTGIGQQALNTNTSGAQNTAVGGFALYSNTTGSANTAVGAGLLGSYFGALGLNTTGSNNTAMGEQALYSNTTASNNTAVGYQAGYSITTSSNNALFGYGAAFNTTTGTFLAAFGKDALSANTTGSSSSAFGYRSLYLNTTGASNVAVGQESLYSNTTASNNTAVGYQAGYGNTTGNSNGLFGYQSGYNLTTGAGNTFVGAQLSGFFVTTGNKNTILGRYDGNQGGLDIRTASSYVVLSDGDGNPGMYFKYGLGMWWKGIVGAGAGTYAVKLNISTGEITYDTSSARYKDNIRNNVYGLDAVMQIRSAQFEYKKEGRTDIGFIAEELNEVIPELVIKDEDGLPNAVSYDRMVSVLVKAVQELKTEFDAYKEAHP